MTTLSLHAVVIAAIIIGLVLVVTLPALRAYLRFRGQRVITCPANRDAAAIHVSGSSAAASAFFGLNSLRLDQCSRWPEHKNCGQECLNQVELEPARCLLWNIVGKWYADKSCVYCKEPIGTIRHLDHAPALLCPDGTTIEWNQFRAEQLPGVLATHRPVCWNCHVTRTFSRLYPELVIDRHHEQYPHHS